MLNLQKVKELRRAVAEREDFSMQFCATCFVGTAKKVLGWPNVYDTIGMGGCSPQYMDMIMPKDYQKGKVTKKQALKMLDHLIETGEVKWPT